MCAALLFWCESSVRTPDFLPESSLRLMVGRALGAGSPGPLDEELIHEAPAPIPQLEEQVSAWQLSPLLDRNPKLHCSSTLHLQPLSSSGACQVPVCAEITCRQGQGILEEDISNSLHFPAYQSQAAQSLFSP